MTKKLYYYTRDFPRIFSTNAIEELSAFLTESHSFFKKDECSYPYNVKVLKSGTTLLEYSLAGFTKKEITLNVEHDNLIIKAKVLPDTKDSDIYEVYNGIAKRSMVHTVPIDPKYVDLKNIKAEFENGILTITIPQSQESKDSHFEVKIK